MSNFETVTVSEDKFLHVKRVLFGKQKQANITNEAVAFIVARYVLSHSASASIDSEAAVVTSIKSCLEEMANGGVIGTDQQTEDFIRLIAGERSYNVLTTVGPKLVNVWQPNPESPKMKFAVVPLGEEPETGDVEMQHQIDDSPQVVHTVASSTGETPPMDVATTTPKDDFNVNSNREDIVQYTEKLKDKVLAAAPTAVITEFGGNDYAAALYMYDAYKKVNS